MGKNTKDMLTGVAVEGGGRRLALPRLDQGLADRLVANGVKVPLTKEVTVARVRRPLDRVGDRPEYGPDRPPTYRTVRRRRRVRSFAGTVAGCTAFVNDGPQLAVTIAEHSPNQHHGLRRPLP